MNIEMRFKYLLYLCGKDCDRGFTIINVVVAIAILGLLSLASLPSQISQAQNSKEAEGRQYVASINRAQQAYYIENRMFMIDNSPAGWRSLALGIKTQTANYKYSISPIAEEGVNAFADATLINRYLRNYTGVVGLIRHNVQSKKTTQAIVCQTKDPGAAPVHGTVSSMEVTCPANASPIFHD